MRALITIIVMLLASSAVFAGPFAGPIDRVYVTGEGTVNVTYKDAQYSCTVTIYNMGYGAFKKGPKGQIGKNRFGTDFAKQFAWATQNLIEKGRYGDVQETIDELKLDEQRAKEDAQDGEDSDDSEFGEDDTQLLRDAKLVLESAKEVCD